MAGAEVNARIVYWGIEGAGTTANLRAIHDKPGLRLGGIIQGRKAGYIGKDDGHLFALTFN